MVARRSARRHKRITSKEQFAIAVELERARDELPGARGRTQASLLQHIRRLEAMITHPRKAHAAHNMRPIKKAIFQRIVDEGKPESIKVLCDELNASGTVNIPTKSKIKHSIGYTTARTIVRKLLK